MVYELRITIYDFRIKSYGLQMLNYDFMLSSEPLELWMKNVLWFFILS
jgi:hypothetical protein